MEQVSSYSSAMNRNMTGSISASMSEASEEIFVLGFSCFDSESLEKTTYEN